jgi:hypothetical protein
MSSSSSSSSKSVAIKPPPSMPKFPDNNGGGNINFSIAYWNYLKNSDWLMRMIFGDEEFRCFHLNNLLSHAKKVMTEHTNNTGNMQIPVYEILEVLGDGSGYMLEEMCNQSMGEPSIFGKKKRALTPAQRDEQSRKETLKILADSRHILNTTVKHADNDEAANSSSMTSPSTGGDPVERVVSDISGIEITALYAAKDFSSGTAERRALLYRQINFLIMLNVYARTKGMNSNARAGASCDYVHLLKDLRDAFVFACPLLWPNIMRWLGDEHDPSPAHFLLPGSRERARAFFEEHVRYYIEKMLSIHVVASDYVQQWSTGIPMDDMLSELRSSYERFVREQHQNMRFREEHQRAHALDMATRINGGYRKH